MGRSLTLKPNETRTVRISVPVTVKNVDCKHKCKVYLEPAEISLVVSESTELRIAEGTDPEDVA